MDASVPCSNILAVQHMVLGFFNLVTALFTAWLVHRRYLADKREAERNGNHNERPKRDE